MFFSDDIDLLKRFPHFNVLCRNRLNGRYCYGFLNSKNGNLSTGYELDKNEDLSIELDKEIWNHYPIEELTFN